jgi:hypothetical protein
MKNILITLAILFIALSIISCNKDDDSNPSTPLPATKDNFIRCKVDGIAYEITGDQIFNYKDASGFNIAYKNTIATTGIDIALFGVPIVQTYTCNSTNLTTVGRLQYDSPNIYSTAFCATSLGIVTITSVNGNTIQGTFSFSGKRLLMCIQPSKVITEGSFKITYE